jgi:UDP-N-acetylglucosamine 2-epimerase (non-hydrolysing)
MLQPILIVIGTRPEGIKLLPVYFACKSAGLPVLLCSTSQHDLLLKSVFELFGVEPDYDLEVMKKDQDLFYLTQIILSKMQGVLQELKPSLVLVQGDTTTAMVTALAAFYCRISVGHVEAGLRTNDLYSPFPEEMNRRFITLVAAYHFAPTPAAVANVLLQGVHRNAVFCTGNTVVDALRTIEQKIASQELKIDSKLARVLHDAQSQNFKLVLLTMHRRESLADGIDRVLEVVVDDLELYPDLFVIFPYHPNPLVKAALERSGLINHTRAYVREAVAYHDLVYLLTQVDWVMTDSGGIQEEAASLGKPTLVLRDHTERMESVWASISHIVGTDKEKIKHGIARMYAHPAHAALRNDLYGDGRAAEKIVQILYKKLSQAEHTPPEIEHRLSTEL